MAKAVKKHSKMAILGMVSAALLLIICAVFAYNSFLNYQDKKKFDNLKADFLSLQTEFNKIDPGWKYGEGCTGAGKFDETASCGISISNRLPGSVDVEARLKLYAQKAIDVGLVRDLKGRDTFTLENGEQHSQFVLISNFARNKTCSLEATGRAGNEQLFYIGCGDSARKFYFTRTDR